MHDRRQFEAIQIQTRMVEVRTGARRQLDHVVQHAQQLTDWRGYVRRHPLWTAGAVATLGYLLSSLLTRRSDRAPRSSAYAPPDPLHAMAGMPRRDDAGVREGEGPEPAMHGHRVHESSFASTAVKMMAGVVAQHLARLAMTAFTEWLTEPARQSGPSEPPPGTADDSPSASDKES